MRIINELGCQQQFYINMFQDYSLQTYLYKFLISQLLNQ